MSIAPLFLREMNKQVGAKDARACQTFYFISQSDPGLRIGVTPVHNMVKPGKSKQCRGIAALAGAAVACFSLCGCAGFWDEVTSRNFEFKHLYTQPNPMLVLKDSTDGNERAKAFRALQEPKQHSGTDQDQDAVVKILTTAASHERQFLCRMAAIDSLGHFKDPRAVTGLTEAFYNSGSFAPELATRIQTQAVHALGETGNPTAVKFLNEVVKGPGGEGSDQEKQQIMDVRIAAARALGHFSDPQGNESLLRVLQNDKDIALRDTATESLQASTGRKLPADYSSWQTVLHPAKDPGAAVVEESSKHKVLGLF